MVEIKEENVWKELSEKGFEYVEQRFTSKQTTKEVMCHYFYQ